MEQTKVLDKGVEDIVNLFFLDSIFSKEIEVESVLHNSNFKAENVKLLSEVASLIHTPRDSVFPSPRKVHLNECFAYAKYWLDSNKGINGHTMSYNNLRKEAEDLMSSRIKGTSAWKSDYKTCKIGVLWDFENCPLPPDYNVASLVPNIRKSLSKYGYKGEIDIVGAGNQSLIFTKEQLTSLNVENINIFDVKAAIPHVKEVADKKLIVEIMKWADLWLKTNDRGVILVVSSDVDFVSTILHLKGSGIRVLLAHNGTATRRLKGVSDGVSLWGDIIQGKK